MRSPGSGRWAAWLLAGLLCALPETALGAAGEQGESELWAPGLAFFGAVLVPQAEGGPQSPLDLDASGDLLGEAGPEDPAGRWIPAIALIVPLPEGDEEGAAEPGAFVAGLVESPAPGAARQAPTPAPPAIDGLPATSRPEVEGERRIPVLAVVLVPEAEPGAPSPVEPGPSAEDPGAAPVASSVAQVTTIEPTPVGDRPATGQPEPKDETERWVPAVAVLSGVLVQPVEASVESSDLVNPEPGACRDPPCIEPVRPSVMGDDLMVSPFVGASAELMTPGLSPVPGRPRFFIHGDLLPSFGFTRDVAKEGAPDSMEVPRLDSGEIDPNYPGVAIEGQGSTTKAELKPLVIGAGAGVAFTVEAWGRRLRFKPSFEYLQEQIEVTGAVHRAVRVGTAEYRFVELRGGAKKTYRGIGPGLEIELDTARAGPFVLALFLSGRAYKILGDRKVEFADSLEIPDVPAELLPPGSDSVDAAWSFEKDPWSYQAGLGVRFRWLPQ